MKNVRDIVAHIKTLKIEGAENVFVNGLQLDSRIVKANDAFFAIKGATQDGHNYIDEVIAKGATVIVCESLPSQLNSGVCYILVQNASQAAGEFAAAFYDFPSSNMKVVGVTGTNGKTTCATLLFQLFSALGYSVGLISTVQNQINDEIIPSTHTTPHAIALQALLANMMQKGCTHVFMEVSSHAVHQHRIAGLQFTGACFTNITHDHLDYHNTFEEYIRVKKKFFDDLPKSAFAITNLDDKRGVIMLQNTIAKKRTYSLRTLADYKGKILENNLTGLIMTINNQEIFFRMIGEFNAYNLLCVYAAACELGEQPQEVLRILSTLTGAEGRFDYLLSAKEQILGIVDYAHTPDALLNVLATINKLRKGNEMVLTVVGCGGDRDKAKRPLMALVACEHSDKVILTSDNPRSEDPMDIIREMEAGVEAPLRKRYVCIADRREAIKTACSLAESGDIILIAGKGHEKYQEVKGVKTPFDDKEILHEMFELFEK